MGDNMCRGSVLLQLVSVSEYNEQGYMNWRKSEVVEK